MVLEQESIDLLFAKPNRDTNKKTAKITCRVCNVKVEVALDWPGLLCAECGGNLEKTAQHVTQALEGYKDQVTEAWERLDADIAHADEQTLARWDLFQNEITAGDPLGRVKKAEEVVRGGAAGPLSELIRAWLNYKDALDRLTEREEWASRARAEIEAWL